MEVNVMMLATKFYRKKNILCRGRKGQAIYIQKTIRSPLWHVHYVYTEEKWQMRLEDRLVSYKEKLVYSSQYQKYTSYMSVGVTQK